MSKAACIQLTSTADIAVNLAAAETLVRAAAAQGAKLILTPENTCQMRHPAAAKLQSTPLERDHAGIAQFSALARDLGVWIVIGSFSIKREDGKLANRSYLFSDTGEIAATYDKIHMFDAQLPTGEIHRESDIVQAGDRAVVATTPHGTLGLSICYDLRFPHLYRDLAKAGAQILSVPAAFTVPTGKAHWLTLLRARAIETGSFVLAAAQVGEHENGRKTWGHSVIINPWGEILAQAGDEIGIITADINLDEVQKARAAIPALQHDKSYRLD